MHPDTLFQRLLRAENEEEVELALSDASYLLEEEAWQPLGFENNFAAIGNQNSDPSGALVEKVINAIDAMLMGECYTRGIDPEGTRAPRTMSQAIEKFFGVRDGHIDNLSASEQTELADNIHLVACGSKQNPNYLIIDRGEGQTPARFADTFVSLMRSNKIRIPFVQGKFNSGGTGILQFCGDKNYELIASRRRPGCPVAPDDETSDLWGFTIVRRLLPSGGRRSSMYVYLAPGGRVPSFRSDSIKVLPGKSKANHPAPPYAVDLPYGTCVKLYDYRWPARSSLTTEGRYELERFLHSPCLPFRITETREYKAHYYSATVIGGWASATSEDEEGESRKLEDGFPGYASLNIEAVGTLPYQIAVFKPGTDPRHVANGAFFLVNGQVHGSLPSDFISRRLRFDYLLGKRGPLLVSVDCTAMDERVREDFFMASRDRIRKNEVYKIIEDKLTEALRAHPGLQEINQQRRKEELEKHLSGQAPADTFQKLLQIDPTLSRLFADGETLVTATGPLPRPPFVGRKFPTFFRLANEPQNGLVKHCAVNRTCRIEFETDASNDYFIRPVDPGLISVDPPDLIEHSHLWNGHFDTRFRVPWDSKPGDQVCVTVTVSDVEREARGGPFVASFVLVAAPEIGDAPHTGKNRGRRAPRDDGNTNRVSLALPKVREVQKEEWEKFGFTKYNAVDVRNGAEGGYDFYVNIDNAFLLNELAKANEQDRPLIKFWFSYGLVLAGLGMVKHHMRLQSESDPDSGEDGESGEGPNLREISRHCDGLAQVIVPIIRSLSHGPVLAAG
ncbi:MAG: hypothetical protein M1570_13695 [Chloroflexi bacterium]|nr:hypothetical protein [Chloroflexota bacterium]